MISHIIKITYFFIIIKINKCCHTFWRYFSVLQLKFTQHIKIFGYKFYSCSLMKNVACLYKTYRKNNGCIFIYFNFECVSFISFFSICHTFWRYFCVLQLKFIQHIKIFGYKFESGSLMENVVFFYKSYKKNYGCIFIYFYLDYVSFISFFLYGEHK